MTGWQVALVAAGHGVAEAGVAGGRMATIGRRSVWLENRAASYVLAPGELRTHDAVSPFKVLGRDIGGLLSVCKFPLGPWEGGPVLHRQTSVDEAFYMVAGRLAAQLDDQRVQAAAGGFVWVPRGTAHTFANAGPEPLHVLALAVSGAVEELFAEQAADLASVNAPDAQVLAQIGPRHGAARLGPPIRATKAPRHRAHDSGS